MKRLSFRRSIRTALSVVLACMLSLGLIPAVNAEDMVAEEKPVLNGGVYEIATAEQLLYLSQNYGAEDCPKEATYKLTADIDMSLVTNYKPIGSVFNPGPEGIWRAWRKAGEGFVRRILPNDLFV